MPVIPFADNFLAGSIISLVMPTLLLVAVVIWYHLEVRRVPGPRPGRPRSPGSIQGQPTRTQNQPTRDRPPGESPPSGA